eukprot:scaffold6249_cov119-Skeletonema_dohrnii-CCMP3373.AAC.6
MRTRTFNRPDGTEIQYEVKGNGPNHVLLLCPGGMWSSRNIWNISPNNPWTDVSLAADFTLIGMDQRMSRHGTLLDDHDDIGWETFRDDQIALLDHLNVEKFHIIGSCIGPSYALAYYETILIDSKEPSLCSRLDDMVKSNRASQEGVENCTRKDATAVKVKHPLLVLAAGVDIYHPSGTAREIARLAPNASLIEGWRDTGPKALEDAVEAIKSHLQLTCCACGIKYR